jgi:hypothetical protein
MMKFMLLVIVATMATSNLDAQIISRKGYPEHFIAGAGIAAGVSYFTFKKTDDKLKAWIFGFGASVAAGGIKELLDPVIFNGTRNVKDFQYTALGGVVGASIVIPLRSRKEKAAVGSLSQ